MPLLEDYPHLKIIQAIAQKRRVKVFLVGGFLRDRLLNRRCQDFDFAVSKGAIKLARLLASRIKGAFILLDEEHGCARVARKTTAGIVTYDFADYRASTLKKDLEHRDFTINTLCVDLNSLKDPDSIPKVLIDHKCALRDIQARKIKMVMKQAFQEDPLRLVRAFSLQANLGFKIDPKTFQAVKKMARGIREVSHERVRDELVKMFTGPDRKSTRLNSSHSAKSRMPSSA